MPVTKYRRVEDMPPPEWRRPGDPQLYRAIAETWAFGRAMSRRRPTPGVRKFRSIEEMNRWDDEQAKRDAE